MNDCFWRTLLCNVSSIATANPSVCHCVQCASIVDGRLRVNSTLVGGALNAVYIMIVVARFLSNVRHPALLPRFLVLLSLREAVKSDRSFDYSCCVLDALAVALGGRRLRVLRANIYTSHLIIEAYREFNNSRLGLRTYQFQQINDEQTCVFCYRFMLSADLFWVWLVRLCIVV